MGRLIYTFNVSIDGFIETDDRSLDWANVDDELHTWFNDQMRTLSGSLYGRRLYEVMAAYWPRGEDNPESTDAMRDFARLWNAMPRFVFSRTLERAEHATRLVRGDVAEVLTEIRGEIDGDLEVAGADLAGQFVRRGLVDEFRLVVHPVALGSGTPYWPALDAPLPLRQIDQRSFDSGVELRSYVSA